MSQVTVGCDPEFTVHDVEGNPVPAHSTGFKEHHEVDQAYRNSKIFRDGYNVEINVRPGTCRALVINNLYSALQDTRANLKHGMTLRARSAFQIDLSQMESAPPDVSRFGCNPSRDAYSGLDKTVEIDARTWPWRYAGGHLHFGAPPYQPKNVLHDPSTYDAIARAMDLYIGLPLAIIYNNDAQWERRKFYGQAGEYRLQNYGNRPGSLTKIHGLEYRTPSSELFSNQALVSLMMGVGRWVIDNFSSIEPLSVDTQNKVRDAINTGQSALKVFKKLKPSVPNFYNVDIILAVKDDPLFHPDYLANDLNVNFMRYKNGAWRDGHYGWGDYVLDAELGDPKGNWKGIRRTS